MTHYFEEDDRLKFETLIQEELADIAHLSDSTEADRAPVALDQQSVGRLSRMDALQGQALAQASDQRRQARRIALELALRRLEEGTFGECLECGDAIAIKRLEIDPAVTRCITCAQNQAG